MDTFDPLADHWIRVGVVCDDQFVANCVFPPRSSITIGPGADDTIRVPETMLRASFRFLTDGTQVHTLPGMQLRLRLEEGVQTTSAEDLGERFRTRATALNLRLATGGCIFVEYVPTEADAERGRLATERNASESPAP